MEIVPNQQYKITLPPIDGANYSFTVDVPENSSADFAKKKLAGHLKELIKELEK